MLVKGRIPLWLVALVGGLAFHFFNFFKGSIMDPNWEALNKTIKLD